MPKVLYAKNWERLVYALEELPAHFYRGQVSSAWQLECSLHRELERNGVSEDSDVLEYFLLREFRRGARRYLSDLPNQDDYVSWLSLMQHHGTPTRLVDFTYSFYVASYFALLSAQRECAVWAVDSEFLFRAAEIRREVGRNGTPEEWEPITNEMANRFLSTRLCSAIVASSECGDKGIIPVDPMDQHPRQAIQQGLFLLPKDPFLSVEENLKPFVRRGEKPVIKIVIGPEAHRAGLAHLREMNITAETLFPGVDGFARSLVHRILP